MTERVQSKEKIRQVERNLAIKEMKAVLSTRMNPVEVVHTINAILAEAECFTNTVERDQYLSTQFTRFVDSARISLSQTELLQKLIKAAYGEPKERKISLDASVFMREYDFEEDELQLP